jgi:hypothetical protein
MERSLRREQTIADMKVSKRAWRRNFQCMLRPVTTRSTYGYNIRDTVIVSLINRKPVLKRQVVPDRQVRH